MLEEAWAFGELLDGPDQLDVVSLGLVVDLPVRRCPAGPDPAPAEALTSLDDVWWAANGFLDLEAALNEMS